MTLHFIHLTNVSDPPGLVILNVFLLIKSMMPLFHYWLIFIVEDKAFNRLNLLSWSIDNVCCILTGWCYWITMESSTRTGWSIQGLHWACTVSSRVCSIAFPDTCFQMMGAVYRWLLLLSIKKHILSFNYNLDCRFVYICPNVPRGICLHWRFIISFRRYLAALISQSFLDIGSVSRILDSIINLCLQLCRVIEQEDGTPNFAELERITEVWLLPESLADRRVAFSSWCL
jgi:hypothetical protein